MKKRDCPECNGVMESFMQSGGDMPDTPDDVYFICKECGCRLSEDRTGDKWVIDIYKHGSKEKRKKDLKKEVKK